MTKLIRFVVIVLSMLALHLGAGEFDKVKIAPNISFIYVYHKGKAVKVHRIQDTKHKLTGEYAKTYRPGTYIQPIRIDNDIQTIGERELIDFMREKVNKKRGLIIDAREVEDYKKETIPSSVNIPLKVIKNDVAKKKLFDVFGIKRRADGKIDASNALELVVYCHGLWCSLAPKFIDELTKNGYPKEKIKFYRGGFQMWKILGFVTIKEDDVKK